MRARTLKPGFFKNELLAECDPFSRIVFAGLWCLADCKGRLEDRPGRIKAELMPFDSIDVGKLLQELHDRGLIVRYVKQGQHCIFIPKFAYHQRPHPREGDYGLPDPDLFSDDILQKPEKGLAEPEKGLAQPDLGDGAPVPFMGSSFPSPSSPLPSPLFPSPPLPPKAEVRATKETTGPKEDGTKDRDAVESASYPEGDASLPVPPTAKPSRTTQRAQPTPTATGFDEFWAMYPKKVAKQAAVRAWNQLSPDQSTKAAISKSLSRQIVSVDWCRDEGRYIPFPASWLNGRRWEDLPCTQGTGTNGHARFPGLQDFVERGNGDAH